MGLVRIRSLKSGIFYSSPEPGKPAFITEGTKISFGQPLCIIEMMKYMNHLTWGLGLSGIAEVIWMESQAPYQLEEGISAVIRRVYLENGAEVQPGVVLFDIEVEESEPLVVRPQPVETSEVSIGTSVKTSSAEMELVEVRSAWVGWYHLSPVYSTKPYVQVGQIVKKGAPLCRIKTRTESRLRPLFGSKRLPLKNYTVRASIKGMIRERCAEKARETERRLDTGSEAIMTVQDGFSVEYNELLFLIEPVD